MEFDSTLGQQRYSDTHIAHYIIHIPFDVFHLYGIYLWDATSKQMGDKQYNSKCFQLFNVTF